MNLTLNPPSPRRVLFINRRSKTLWTIGLCVALFVAVIIGSRLIGDAGLTTNLRERNLAPSLAHPFGTDWLGRDMFTRTLHGLSLSLLVGLIASTISALIGAALGALSATLGGILDAVVTWIIDVFFSLPHLVLLILISFAIGGGTLGVLVAVSLTHWPSLARIVRAEILQVRQSDYAQLSYKLGHSSLWVAWHHMRPHLVPQFIVGLILLFPHAILHEAGLSFLGMGFSPNVPAIGVILSESMRYLTTGAWWLAVMPGLMLLIMVKTFDVLGENVRDLIDPKTSQE